MTRGRKKAARIQFVHRFACETVPRHDHVLAEAALDEDPLTVATASLGQTVFLIDILERLVVIDQVEERP
ncbi:hypothetical protein WK43_28825 [Burkholderia ubonensis]|nr:hypothetical protein WK37_25550 [Burkholderia ubonensis]KVS45928.1 hypothetical protein WK38_22850 [Burkholderia ubonensis]KVS72224.1 hypothetical protein WK42_24340 [Burkholderia ubonensis]KVS80532.1 hypothetical protein WK43_28825 [Burkholderia ubonensis]KVS95709.1 hypothetical protein WK44_06545 [Burkholderia ubonensis]